MSYDDILLETEDRMEKSVESLKGVLRGIRTGRATPALVEYLQVEYYGTATPLKQLATISTPDSRMLLIKPFDPGSTSEIEKAILKSDLGLTPSSDGKVIRLQVPPLSEERRKQLVGQAKEAVEKVKVSLRNVRRDANKQAEGLKKDTVLTEDELHKLKDEVHTLTKEYEQKVAEILETKTKEVLED